MESIAETTSIMKRLIWAFALLFSGYSFAQDDPPAPKNIKIHCEKKELVREHHKGGDRKDLRIHKQKREFHRRHEMQRDRNRMHRQPNRGNMPSRRPMIDRHR